MQGRRHAVKKAVFFEKKNGAKFGDVNIHHEKNTLVTMMEKREIV